MQAPVEQLRPTVGVPISVPHPSSISIWQFALFQAQTLDCSAGQEMCSSV